MTDGIGPAGRADVPAMCALLGELFAQEHEFTPDPQRQRRALEAILSDPACGCLLVARERGEVVGMVNLLFSISTALGAPVATLEDLVVSAAARGRGHGKALLAAALETAKERGCLRISLLTDHDNQRAQALYGGHGFTLSTMRPMRHRLD